MVRVGGTAVPYESASRRQPILRRPVSVVAVVLVARGSFGLKLRWCRGFSGVHGGGLYGGCSSLEPLPPPSLPLGR